MKVNNMTKQIKTKHSKTKYITVAVQKVQTTYLKVIATTDIEAEKIAKGWYEEGKYDSKIAKVNGEPAEYLNGPITFGFTTHILGNKIEEHVDLSDVSDV